MNIKDQIETTFNPCLTNHCIETYTIDFDVLDDRIQDGNPRPCYKVDFGQGEFSIESNGNLVHFLKVDDCILFDTDGKKCDFAVFTKKEFVFIELKEIEIGTKSGSKKKGNKKRSCYPQLESTLNEFADSTLKCNFIFG